MPEHIPFIRIFISSPGDVNDERKIALDVIEQLPYRPAFREKVAFRVIAWDKPGAGTVMRAMLTPQDAINKGLPTPAECDIVVVLFWSRMGTPFTHTDGREYASGTYWELMNAIEANRPETVIYRRTDDPPLKVSDHDFDKKYAQYKKVTAFFESELFYDKDGKITRGINQYKTPEDFRRAFEIDLEILVLDILSRLNMAVAPEPALKDNENISTVLAQPWDPTKSPFPGLRAFTEADADIFFGRGYETDGLIRQMQASRFVAVVGASGSGKSSLVGAGLVPRLRANALRGSKAWHVGRFTPGEAPLENLYNTLLEIFPQFRPNPLEARRIKQNFLTDLRDEPKTLIDICTAGLDTAPAWAEVLFFVDQFEELFTLAPKEDAQIFANLLAIIIASERVRLVVTMRADFYHRAVEYPQLAELLRTGSFPLAIPKRDALRQMIERPAERAGLTFDHELVDRLLNDTGDEPGNLALMAYTLDELYKRDHDRILTHAEYNQIGGVQGAIGTRAEDTFMTLNGDDQTMQQVFHALVEVDERGTATRRRAQFQSEAVLEEVRNFIDAFTDARLLTTSYEYSTRTATVEVAHEAILRSWPRLATWIEDTQDDLRLLRQVRSATHEWAERARPEFLLWPQERLKLVYAMLERLNPEMSENEREFIEPEQARLLRELEQVKTTHERRRDIGDRLAVIGDMRDGVGIKDGLPNLNWLLVPASSIPVSLKTDVKEIGPLIIPPFFVSQYLITYTQFQVFLDADDGFEDERWWVKMPNEYRKQKMAGQRIKISNAPRDSVSAYQALAFGRWLNDRLSGLELPHHNRILCVGVNAEVRLPTELEWQWIAQGGTQAQAYPWGEWQEGYANTSEAGLNRTTAVGMYPHGAASCGALDVSGNLHDWCLDEYKQIAKFTILQDESKVLRGGSFNDSKHYAKASSRYLSDLSHRSPNFGFRLVVSVPIASLNYGSLTSESE